MQLRQCFPEPSLSDWKKPDFVFFFNFQKSQRCSKKVRILKSGFKKVKLATLTTSSTTGKHTLACNRNKIACFLLPEYTDWKCLWACFQHSIAIPLVSEHHQYLSVRNILLLIIIILHTRGLYHRQSRTTQEHKKWVFAHNQHWNGVKHFNSTRTITLFTHHNTGID